ncbi:hypothetical protein [uncultured Paraglaciecola sp.]|jgi:DEAD/DEAH box helicase domain-containing protein|uniref:hypothetical protein n=1 Tax=uncultured Paraglaciecola sp. TaxID=1765024 RepID=UPI0025FE6619|nr:hypothetical protein [uncultured Paraglaciecola sp.]
MIEVFNLWFKKGVKVSTYMDVHEDKASISHRRELLLSFKNGNKYSVGFDQGVGYWNHDLGWNKHYFDFKDVNTQLSQLFTAWDKGRVKNGYEWKTVLYVNKV